MIVVVPAVNDPSAQKGFPTSTCTAPVNNKPTPTQTPIAVLFY